MICSTELLPPIKTFLELGKEGKVEESPKMGDIVFEKVYNSLIGSNIISLRAAEKKATSLGLNTLILSSSIEGETREAARFHTAIAKEVISSGNPIPKPACILSGGETTVTIKGRGLRREKPRICFGRSFRNQRDRKGGPPERRDGWNRWTHGRFRRGG